MAENNIRIVYGVKPPKIFESAYDAFETSSHPDERIEELIDHVPSDSECGSDNSESSRTGALDYFPQSYDNKKKPVDTIERCTENNDAAYDDAYEVESDMSSLESPRDLNTVTDSAGVNPRVGGHDVIIDMPPDKPEVQVDDAIPFTPLTNSSSFAKGNAFDEAVTVQSDEEEPSRPLNPTTAHQKLYGTAQQRGYSAGYGDWGRKMRTDLTYKEQLEHELSRQRGTAPLASEDDDFPLEMQPMEHVTSSCNVFDSREKVEKSLASHFTSEDSKSSEDSLKQEGLKKKRKKRKTKSATSSEVDNMEMDENGNPPVAECEKQIKHRYASADITKEHVTTTPYQNRTFIDTVHPSILPPNYKSPPAQSRDQERLVDGLRVKKDKKLKKEKSDYIKAADIPGNQGNKDIESLLEFIDGDSVSKKTKKTVKYGDPGATTNNKKEKKGKSKTPEPRADQETDSNSSETVSIPEQSSGRKGSDTDARSKLDVDVDEPWSAVRSEEFIKVVGGKKKKRVGKEKDDFLERRLIRSKTPPPRSHDAKLPLVSPPASGVKMEDRSLSPSAFPLLNGDVPSSGRRNSTGNAPSEIQERDVGVHALLRENERSAAAPVSYAKIAAASQRLSSGYPGVLKAEKESHNDEYYHNYNSYAADADVGREGGSVSPPGAETPSNEKPSVTEAYVSKHTKHASDWPVEERRSVRADVVQAKTDSSTAGGQSSATTPRKPSDHVARDVTPPVSSRDEFPSLPRLAWSSEHDKANRPGATTTAVTNNTAALSFANAAHQATGSQKTVVPSRNPSEQRTGALSPVHCLSNPPAVPDHEHGPLTVVEPVSADPQIMNSDPEAVAGAPSKQAVIFLDGENYSPQDLGGIIFAFDETLASEPPPELVAAVEQGQFIKPRSESPCELSFMAAAELAPPEAGAQRFEAGAPRFGAGESSVNGMVAPERPILVPTYKTLQSRRYREDDQRFNLTDAVRFLQREWFRIQEHKRKGTMRVLEYSAVD